MVGFDRGVPKDGSATRRRLLDAATAEFSRRGIAGARVDRIADAAEANKAQIYAWFSSKDGLFDAVFLEHLALIVDLVPFDAFDLPGYAVRLYDAYLDAAVGDPARDVGPARAGADRGPAHGRRRRRRREARRGAGRPGGRA